MKVTVGFYNPELGFEPVAHIPCERAGEWLEMSFFKLLSAGQVRVNGQTVHANQVMPMACYDFQLELLMTQWFGDRRE